MTGSDSPALCSICRTGEAAAGTVTVTLQRCSTTVVIKDVPAEVCNNCGEYFLSEAITREVLARAEEAVRKGAEVEILRYAA